MGFGIGLERLLLALESQAAVLPDPTPRPVWVIAQSDAARDEALTLLRSLRRSGIAADMDYTGRGTKAQFKLADRASATHCLILGDRELSAGVVAVKDLTTGEQREVERGKVLEVLTSDAGDGPH